MLVAAEYHILYLFNVWVVFSLIIKLLHKSGTCIPLGFLSTIFIKSGDVRNELETTANIKCLFKEFRVDIRPSKLGRIFQDEVHILLETLMIYVIQKSLILIEIGTNIGKQIIVYPKYSI
mgnify:CR=1 FL=1